MKTYPYNRYDRRAVNLLILTSTLIFGIMLLYVLNVRGGDYVWHLQFALGLHDGTMPPTANPLFHLLVLSLYVIPGIGLSQAGFIIALVVYILIGIALFALYIRPALVSLRNRRMMLVAVLLVLSLMLLSAITVPSWPTRNLYWGYIVPSAYHNPTIVVLRLVTLLLFLRVAGIFAAYQQPAAIRALFITAVLAILNALAKPNYIIALIPAVALVAAFRFARKEPVDWRHLILGVILPGALVIVVQLVFLPDSTGDGTGGGVMFAPLVYANITSQGPPLLPKFFLSILFPLAVYACYYRQARTNAAFNLSWVIFAFGAFYHYTLVESQRVGHGNFQWSAQITLFMLFVVSTTFFLRRIYSYETGFRINRAALVCLLLFGLHVVSGLLWYYSEITSITETRWW